MTSLSRTLRSIQNINYNRFCQRLYNCSVGASQLPAVVNEAFLHYEVGSVHRDKLKQALKECRNEVIDIPCIVGGKEIRTGDLGTQVCPSDHKHVLAKFHKASPEVIQEAISSASKAKEEWELMDVKDRLAIFTKAASLLSKVFRYKMMAATMLGTGKNVWQGEIDCAVELIDFWRFGAKFTEDLYKQQINHHENGNWNILEYRPLEGFVCAISPFNFAAIGGNLCSTPALVGNTVLWKPASTSVLSNYVTYQILKEAGLPDGVINFLPCQGSTFSKYGISHRDFSGINFTGSTEVFRNIWSNIGNNLSNYKSYPRIVGETGGKNYHMIHNSFDDLVSISNCAIRGAFEYQGQKCSATSRMYVPKSIWPKLKDMILSSVKEIKLGQPEEFDIFMTGVIDSNSFNNISSYIDKCKNDSSCTILCGGKCDNSIGYFVEPTIIETTNPKSVTMCEEIFGPVLTIYAYEDEKYEETLHLLDSTSNYGLTGSIFCKDRNALIKATHILRNSAGNFYINDKSTGSVVGQQPFGGARASGTNDKAGWASVYTRFVSIRSIKENFLPINDFKYPHMVKS